MGWLFLGVVYSCAYGGVGWMLREQPDAARLVSRHRPARSAAGRRRGHRRAPPDVARLPMAVLGDDRARPRHVGARADRMGGRRTDARPRRRGWRGRPCSRCSAASRRCSRLLAQPHRGAREPLAATTAVDIAGLAVVTGFLYSFFITAPTSTVAADRVGAAAGRWSSSAWRRRCSPRGIPSGATRIAA